MSNFKPKQKTSYEKGPGVMYCNEEDGKDTTFNLILNVDKLPAANEKGEIVLIGFINTYKKTSAQPDVNFRVPKKQPKKEFAPKQKDTPESDSDDGGADWF